MGDPYRDSSTKPRRRVVQIAYGEGGDGKSGRVIARRLIALDDRGDLWQLFAAGDNDALIRSEWAKLPALPEDT